MRKSSKHLYRHLLCIVLCALGWSNNASAQFYTNGVDPSNVHWSSVTTQNFKLIYPKGLDSLARVYGTELEKWRTPVSGSIGYLPGQQYRKPTPVILHPFHGVSNGSVVWAPRRMDLYTVMSPYEADAMPWVKNLAIHESRHVSQMQFGKDGILKVGHYLIGEMFTGSLAGVYQNPAFDEGDAVVTETALTTTGRGRHADFLEWYRLSFDKGDFRNWYRWRYGSQKLYTPNYYTIGYITIGGIRYISDDANFTKRYYEKLTRNPFRFGTFQKTMKEFSGKKFKNTFLDIAQAFDEAWKQEDKLRLEPLPFERLTEPSNRYSVLRGATLCGEDIYAIRNGLTESSVLVKISADGQQTTIRPFSGNTSKLEFSPKQNRIYWSEGLRHPLWDLSMQTVIRFYDLESGKVGDLTNSGRLFNPSVSPDGTKIATTEYAIDASCSVVVISSQDGHIIERIPAPYGVQIEESAWRNDGLYASGISEEGYGLYRLFGREWKEILSPTAVKIKSLKAIGQDLLFTCDLSGVDEIYSLNENGSLDQITASKYGASDFVIKDSRLVYANLDSDGKSLVSIAYSPVKTDIPFAAHQSIIADKLSAQEKDLGTAVAFEPAQFSEVKDFNKVKNLIHIHSWAPLFFNYNSVENLSFDQVYNTSSPGATALFQNYLGTMYGSFGYSYRPDELDSHNWRSSYHADFTYQGWYPRFDVKLDINNRDMLSYGIRTDISNHKSKTTIAGTPAGKPLVSGNIKAYLPLSFSRGGWLSGVIPQIHYTVTNDRFDKSLLFVETLIDRETGEETSKETVVPGKTILMQTMVSSVRGYIMRPTASSAIFPRLGIGIEAGYKSRLGMKDIFNTNAYFYAYGYLPGIIKQHGLRLTGLVQKQINDGIVRENAVSFLPRGFQSSALSKYLANNSTTQTKITAEYAMPILPVDWTFLCPLFYIRNFELRPHADILLTNVGKLSSVGSDFNVHLGNFVWMPYDTTFGITWSYNGGSAYRDLEIPMNLTRNHFGINFEIDF